MKVIRSFRSNLIIRGTDIYIAKSKSRSIERLFSYTRKYRFPLCYPLRQKVSSWLNFLQSTFGKKRGFSRKKKSFPPNSQFCKVLFTKSVVTFRKGQQNYYAKSKQLIVSHIRLNFVFPYGIPSEQNGSPRLAVLQGTFGKKRGFCRKGKRLIRGTKITTLNQSKKSLFIYTWILFSLTISFPNKKSRLDSTFCKVLFTKSVVFVKRDRV